MARHGKRHHMEGGIIAFKWNGKSDVRSYKPSSGYNAVADLIEHHPTTGEFLGESQWWMFLSPKEGA